MTNSPRLMTALGIGIAISTIPAAYLILRFAPHSVEIATSVVGTLLVCLAVLGYLATKRGNAAAFVAIALLLPYLLIAAVAYAELGRASSAMESIFGGDDAPSLFEDSSDSTDGTYGSDPDLDALQDECVAGSIDACNDLYLQAPSGSEYESTAQENGGGF